MSEPARPPAADAGKGKGKMPDKQKLLIGGGLVGAVALFAIVKSKGGGSPADTTGTGTTFSAPPTYSGDVNVPNYDASLAQIQDELAMLVAAQQHPGRPHPHPLPGHPPKHPKHPKHGKKHEHPPHGRPPHKQRRRRHEPRRFPAARGKGAETNPRTAPHLMPHALRQTTAAPRRRQR